MARSFRRNCRGQVIVVTALLVALIFLSTAMYVIEIEKETPTVQSNDGVPIDSYQNSVRSSLVSALANISAGGNPSILASDLAQLKSVILAHSYESQLTLDYTLFNNSGYSNGVLISWNSTGNGISSVYALVSCTSLSQHGSSAVSYAVNITSRIYVTGYFTRINNTHNQVNLVINLTSESGPMLAERFVFGYFNSNQWVTETSPTIINYGNGTYDVTFVATTGPKIKTLDISTLSLDNRGTTVCANVTCNIIV